MNVHLMKYREELRRILKDWERTFQNQEGRYPEKEDIKKDAKIRKYYKIYNQIRTGKKGFKLTEIENIDNNPLDDKKIQKGQEKDTIIISKNEINKNDIDKNHCLILNEDNDEEIGPTPQKIGKPIGIFDRLEDDSYIFCKMYQETGEKIHPFEGDIINSTEKNISILKTPSKTFAKTPDKNNCLTTPVFLQRTVNISSPTFSKFPFKMSLLCKTRLSLLKQQMEDNIVDPGEEVLREIEEKDNEEWIRKMQETEFPEKSDFENKIVNKRKIRRSRRVILRPAAVKKQSKKLEHKDILDTLVDKNTSQENNILHENKILGNVDIEKKGRKETKRKSKGYIKGKGCVLRSQVSRNYVRYK
ncbi:hypothetical protein PCK2_000985, partial [Pneumocystis canis]